MSSVVLNTVDSLEIYTQLPVKDVLVKRARQAIVDEEDVVCPDAADCLSIADSQPDESSCACCAALLAKQRAAAKKAAVSRRVRNKFAKSAPPDAVEQMKMASQMLAAARIAVFGSVVSRAAMADEVFDEDNLC